jgi:hypothetical protein
MSKQTAVEWLIDEIRNHIKEHGRLDAITISALRTMAKGTEKQQIIDAYKIGYDEGLQIITKYENVEDYYISTYK